MNDSVPTKCLIVGMGSISLGTLGVLKTKPWFECAGVVDVSDAGLAAGREAAGLPDSALFRDLGRALAELKPGAVMINTPSELHFAQAKQCLEAGCHVLVAKPVTNDFAQAVELVELAAAKGLKLCVAQQIRYNRHYTALAEYVKSGALGSVEAAWFMNSKPRPNVAQPRQDAAAHALREGLPPLRRVPVGVRGARTGMDLLRRVRAVVVEVRRAVHGQRPDPLQRQPAPGVSRRLLLARRRCTSSGSKAARARSSAAGCT